MNALFDRIEREAMPGIEKELGHEALIAAREDGMFQFRIVAEENLDETNGEGKWREWMRGRLLAVGAPCVKVSPVMSPFHPEERNALMAKRGLVLETGGCPNECRTATG